MNVASFNSIVYVNYISREELMENQELINSLRQQYPIKTEAVDAS
ncbi:MAG: hypothetical protein Fur0021_11150 [Candidatus Promineifilaceae bacterium]